MTHSISARTACCVFSAIFSASLSGCGGSNSARTDGPALADGGAIGSGGVVNSGGVAGGGGTNASGGMIGTGGYGNGGTLGSGGVGGPGTGGSQAGGDTSQPIPNDAGTASDAGTAGNACVTNSSLADYQSSASGSFLGSDLDGVICSGGAFAYLERTQASLYVGSQLLVFIDSSFGNPADNFQFKTPANATGAMLTIMAGVSSTSPGTYVSSQGQSCGAIAFCVYLPLPASVHCPDDAGACPSPYCAMLGPMMDLTCQPVPPEVCYQAKAASNCLPGSQSPVGSWTLALTSVTPYSSDAGSTGMSYYLVHGTLTATMVEDQSAGDAGGVTASLSLTF